MNRRSAPPRWAERLMRRRLSTQAATHGVLGDLREEYQSRLRQHSRLPEPSLIDSSPFGPTRGCPSRSSNSCKRKAALLKHWPDGRLGLTP